MPAPDNAAFFLHKSFRPQAFGADPPGKRRGPAGRRAPAPAFFRCNATARWENGSQISRFAAYHLVGARADTASPKTDGGQREGVDEPARGRRGRRGEARPWPTA